MNTLLQKVRNFDKKRDEREMKALINDLGECPSIATLEAVLKYYKDKRKTILSKDLLEWMVDNDQVVFETEDMKVAIKTYVSAKMVDFNSGAKWLEENQYGDLIKDSLDFPKGEFTPELAKVIDEMGLSYDRKTTVHPQSLKKVISDRLKAGEMLPDEETGIKVNYYDECVVKEK